MLIVVSFKFWTVHVLFTRRPACFTLHPVILYYKITSLILSFRVRIRGLPPRRPRKDLHMEGGQELLSNVSLCMIFMGSTRQGLISKCELCLHKINIFKPKAAWRMAISYRQLANKTEGDRRSFYCRRSAGRRRALDRFHERGRLGRQFGRCTTYDRLVWEPRGLHELWPRRTKQ